MAEKNDRNLWDALGFSKNNDLQSTVESKRRVCVNGVEERGVDNVQSLNVEGPFFPLKAAPSHSPVTMSTVSCSSDFQDEPLRNGGELVELPKRHVCNSSKAMENSINCSKGPVEERQEICNGVRSNSVVNDTVMESKERCPVNEVEANEKSLETAVIVKSSDQTQTPSVRPVRSIFDHINSNFRSSTVSNTAKHYGGITHKEGLIMNSCKNQANVSPNMACLPPRDKQQIADAHSNRDSDSNLFERMRLSTGIADVTAHGQSAVNGIPGFPFSEKLRRLTALKTDNGNIISNAVQPLQTGYDAVNNGGTFRHVRPLRMAAQTPTDTVSARFVSGQNNSRGTEINTQTNTSNLDTTGVRFQSLSSLSYVDPTSGYVTVRIQNGIPENTSGPLSALNVSDGVGGITSTVVMDNSVVHSNLTGLTPSSQLVRLNRVVLDPVGKLKEQANGNSLNKTYLVGPFTASNPRPVSGYITTVTPAQTYRSDVVVTSPFTDIPPTRAFSQEHSSNSRFPIVSPVIGSVGAVNPIVAQTTPVVTVSRHQLSREIVSDLSCAERLQPSPELKERRFRPVSPAKGAIHSESPLRIDDSGNSGQISSCARPLISNLLSISSNRANSDQRGSIEEEFADQSYECALCESANSPDIERYLRCESPVTVQTSPLAQQSNSDSTNNSGEIANVQTTTIMQSVDEHECNDTSTIAEELSKITELDSTEDEVVKDTNRVFKKRQQGPAMVRRLKTRLPSPVREHNNKGDLYRDPSELTREERALQRAMMQFSVMEMKERTQAVKTKHLIKRRLRKRSKMQAQTVENTNRAGSKPWLKRIRKHRLWFSQRKRITVKLPAQENNAPTRTNDVQQTQIVRRKRKAFKALDITDGQHKNKRTSKEKGREDAIVQPTDVQQIKETPSIHTSAEVKQVSARKRSRETLTQKRPKKEDLAAESSSGKDINEACSYKRSLSRDETTTEMRKKTIKRTKMETQRNTIERKVESPAPTKNDVKPDRSHRVKTYMLVTSYQGFRDFTPVVLQSRTRGKSKSSDEIENTPRSSEFPLLVVESVHSKLVKERVIAETVEVRQMVENSLKARGKWHGDALQAEFFHDTSYLVQYNNAGAKQESVPGSNYFAKIEEFLREHYEEGGNYWEFLKLSCGEKGETNEDESLQEARKLNVNRNTGETILHKAARLGYHETVRHHIHQGVDPNAKDNAGWTPLHEACSRGNVDVVKVLTKYGSDVNTCSNDGIRPIHDAAEGGHVNVLRVLLSYGADPLLATYSGNTASGCARETRTRAFLEGYLDDVGISSSLSSASEGEGGWEFTGSCSLLDEVPEHTTGIFDGVPEGESICDGEFEMCDRPHIPTYNLPVIMNDEGTSGRRNYVLLSDLLKQLRMSKAVLMKKCRRLDIREMPWSQFLAEISDSPLCIMPKFPPADSSRQEGIAELVPLNYSVRRLLNIRVECVNLT